jgi:hypothetical protein
MKTRPPTLYKDKRVVRATNRLAIVSRAISEIDNKCLVDVMSKHPLSIMWLSLCYPLSPEIIRHYWRLLEWINLSKNRLVDWPEDLIEEHKECLKWAPFSRYLSMSSTPSLLIKYADKLDWSTITRCAINMPEDVIDKLQGYLIWEDLPKNDAVQWSSSIITKYFCKWDWTSMARYCKYPNLYLDFNGCIDVYELSGNEHFPWTFEFIFQHKNELNWTALSVNPSLPWSTDLLNAHLDNWDWDELSLNPALPWSVEFIEQFAERWWWGGLAINPGLPWSKELFERYKDRWIMNADRVCWNEKFPWSEDIVNQLGTTLDWKILSMNDGFPWSENFIRWHQHELSWGSISRNENIPWSLELIDLTLSHKSYPQNESGRKWLSRLEEQDVCNILEKFRRDGFTCAYC